MKKDDKALLLRFHIEALIAWKPVCSGIKGKLEFDGQALYDLVRFLMHFLHGRHLFQIPGLVRHVAAVFGVSPLKQDLLFRTIIVYSYHHFFGFNNTQPENICQDTRQKIR